MELAERLRGAGVRLTRARRAVIGVLEQRHREHLSAEDIHRLSEELGEPVDLASVYRTMHLLAELGLVHRTGLEEPHAHFEIAHAEEVHLACRVCGGVVEAPFPGFGRVSRALGALARRQRFELSRFRVDVEGRCERCAVAS